MTTNRATVGTWMLGLVMMDCGGASGVSTGLPRDQALSTLTTADMKKACLNTRMSFQQSDAAIRGVCAAQLSPDGEAACVAGLEACVTESKATLGSASSPAECDKPSATDTTRFTSCTAATVGALEDCWNEIQDYTESTYSGVTCGTPRPEKPYDPIGGSKCRSLRASCPTVFGSDQPAG